MLSADRWMKIVAETVQELKRGHHGETGSMQQDPLRGISCVSVLVQAACKELTDMPAAAAAVVAVVKAVASALDTTLDPEEAALCSFKVGRSQHATIYDVGASSLYSIVFYKRKPVVYRSFHG